MTFYRSKDDGLAFEAMDDFMNHVVDSLMKYGAQAVRVFPRESRVLVAFADRLANDVVSRNSIPFLVLLMCLQFTNILVPHEIQIIMFLDRLENTLHRSSHAHEASKVRNSSYKLRPHLSSKHGVSSLLYSKWDMSLLRQHSLLRVLNHRRDYHRVKSGRV